MGGRVEASGFRLLERMTGTDERIKGTRSECVLDALLGQVDASVFVASIRLVGRLRLPRSMFVLTMPGQSPRWPRALHQLMRGHAEGSP